MSFFYDLNKKLDSIRATPEVTHKQLNERDMSRAAKGYEKYGKEGMEALAKAGREGKALDPVRKKYDKYDNTEVDEGVMDIVKSVGKRVASGINRLVGHGSDEDMRKAVQRKAGAPVTGKKPEQKTTEAAKYRDPKYKDKLYTQEPPDYTYGPDMDDAYDNPKPDDYAGRKRKIGGGEFDHNDPLVKGFGRSGTGSPVEKGPRKGLPTRNQITSLKGSIKAARGTHAEPNLPEAAGAIDFDKVLDAIAALYGDDMWNNDAMQDLANELEQAGPTDRELDFIIAKGRLPKRLAGIQFSAGDSVQFGESGASMTAKQKSFAKLAPPANKITFADKIAGAKKEVDEMLGDVAAEAMRSALGGGKGRNAEMDEEKSKGTAFDMSTPRVDTPKAGSTERGHKHDITHSTSDPRYKGRTVIRRTDAQGISVDSETDDEGNKKEKQNRPGAPEKKNKKPERVTAKAYKHKGERKVKEGADQGQAQQIVDDLAELRAAAKQAQRGGEFPQGFASRLEVTLYAAMTLIKNQQPSDAQVREEEKTSTRDSHAEKAGKKVAKDIEYDEKKKDDIHGKKRGPEDAKAEKAGKKVTKDIEHDEKKKEKEVDESTTSGAVATSTAAPKSGGMGFGKGIYDSMNRELENMIAESLSINMSDSTEGNKSLTVTATDDDAMKLAMMLKSAGLGGQGGDMHSHGEEPCATCGMPDCGCGDVQEAVDENSPDYPTNTEQADNNFGYSGGLNKPKTDVAGDGQTTIPNSAVHTQEEDALRRMMEMAGIKQAELEPSKETMKEEEEDFFHNPNVPADKQLPAPPKEVELDETEEDTVEESIRRMREIAGIKEAKKQVDQNGDGKNDFEDIKIARMKASGAIDDKEEKKVDESIFALTNQWRAYKG